MKTKSLNEIFREPQHYTHYDVHVPLRAQCREWLKMAKAYNTHIVISADSNSQKIDQIIVLPGDDLKAIYDVAKHVFNATPPIRATFNYMDDTMQNRHFKLLTRVASYYDQVAGAKVFRDDFTVMESLLFFEYTISEIRSGHVKNPDRIMKNIDLDRMRGYLSLAGYREMDPYEYNQLDDYGADSHDYVRVILYHLRRPVDGVFELPKLLRDQAYEYLEENGYPLATHEAEVTSRIKDNKIRNRGASFNR